MSIFKTTAGAAAFAAFLMVLAGPVHAQKKPTQAEIDIAREIVVLKGANSLFEQLVPGVIEQTKAIIVQQDPAIQKDADAVAAKMRVDLAPRIKDVVTEVATAYASHFTEPELKDLLAFYKTPLGKKAVVEEPKALEQGMGFAQTWAQNFNEEVLNLMRAELKKKGHNL
jgi:hypothetical protein